MAIEMLVRDSALKAMTDNVANARNAKVIAKTKDGENKTPPVVTTTTASVDVIFTKEAQDLSKATEIAYQSEGIDYAKVAEIKEQVENGTYEVNASRIADKMLSAEEELNSIF